jgi:head-tail adaptor
MSNLTDRLINRIEVWGKVKFENEHFEEDYRWDRIKYIWSEIIPTGGSLATGQPNDISYAKITHKITVRNNAIPNLSNSMYLIYKGQRFDINFFQPNYKYKDAIELMCTLVVQNDSDLGQNDNDLEVND